MSVYDIVTERITAIIEAGTVPWRKPWTPGLEPRNLVSNKPYRGINTFLLGALPYGSPYFLTYKQAEQLGGTVRKGEKSHIAVFWKLQEKAEADESGKVTKRNIPILRYFNVFNLDQCDDVRMPAGRPLPEVREYSDLDRIAAADLVVAGYTDGPRITHGGDGAYYRPAFDEVTLPQMGRFASVSEYYSTLFHELGHSTGHADRLDRFSDFTEHRFGSPNYAREELVAEMTAAFLCGHTGVLPATIENSAAYLAGWLQAIKADPKALVVAAGQAQKAADLILGTSLAEVAE